GAAEGGRSPVQLVGRDLVARAASPEDDAPVGLAAHDGRRGCGTERRVVDGRLGVGTEVDDLVATVLQVLDEQRLEGEAGVVRGDSDSHERAVYPNASGRRLPFPGASRGPCSYPAP